MNSLEPSDYIKAFKRRKGLLLATTGLILTISLCVAFLLPPRYQSTAIIQIEQQEVPQDLVRSTITSFADQRVQMIGQRIKSAGNLERIITKFNLYEKELKQHGLEKVLLEMRDAIGLSMISADVMDPRSGRPIQANIAFKLAYDNNNPELAKKVAAELVELYLSENRKNRARLAAETANFLADESDKLQLKIKQLGEQLADFKEENVGLLPEHTSLNLQLMQRMDTQILDIDRQIAGLHERKVYLESELTQIEPHTTLFDENGQRVLSSTERLRALETRFSIVSSRYTERHPDYRKLSNEIAQLRQELGIEIDPEVSQELALARAALTEARQKYSDSHPDVVVLKRTIEAIETELAKQTEDEAQWVETPGANNPAYVQVKTQLEAVDSEMGVLLDTRLRLNDKLDALEGQMTRTPQVERDYRAIVREYESATQQYSETRARQMEAQLAESLERDRKGERFSVVEPPRLPIRPISPNRAAIVVLGFILALGAGMGVVVLAHAMDTRIHGGDVLSREFGISALALIPMIVTDSERRKAKLKRIYAVTGSVLVIPVMLVVLHLAYRPLDVIWFQVARKLGMGV